jgi:hypothetical protein
LQIGFLYRGCGDVHFASQSGGLTASDAATRETQHRQKNSGLFDALLHRDF